MSTPTPVTPITQTITTLPQAPSRQNDTQTEFDDNTEAFLPALEAMGPEENTMASQMNVIAGETNTNAQVACDSANAASAAANFKGNWSDLTGALNIPASVQHTGTTWNLLVNLADVTASEPSGANADWQELNVIPLNPIAAYSESAGTPTGTSTITIDASEGNEFEVTLTENATLAFTGLLTGVQMITLRVTGLDTWTLAEPASVTKARGADVMPTTAVAEIVYKTYDAGTSFTFYSIGEIVTL